MKKFDSFIEKNIKHIITFFLLSQPFLDTITGLTTKWLNLNIPISPTIRLLFMLFCIYYILKLNKEKQYKKKILIILTYFIIFVTATLIQKRTYTLIEIKNLLNTFYLPVVLIGLLGIFEQNKIKFNLKTIILTYFIYISLIIIPNITHTAFTSYEHSKTGYVGWFPLANVIGNVLSILLPLIIYYLSTFKNKYILKIIIIIPILYVFVSIGTKVPILALGICILTNTIYLLKTYIKNKKYKNLIITSIITIILLFASIIIIPKTSFYKNIQIHKEFLGIKNNTEILKNYKLIDHLIFSQRLTFLSTIYESNINCNLIQKIIGIGFVKNYGTEISTKNIEIDYFDIIFENGILGATIYAYILIPEFIKAFKKTKNKTLINLEYKTSLLLILIIALFAGHVITSPATSIFVALILTTIIKGGLNEKNN